MLRRGLGGLGEGPGGRPEEDFRGRPRGLRKVLGGPMVPGMVHGERESCFVYFSHKRHMFF